MLVEAIEPGESGAPPAVVGRAAVQGPDVDGVTTLVGMPVGAPLPRIGEFVPARVVGSEGVELIAEVVLPTVVLPTGERR